MVVFPNAKINLGLRVKSRRPDGYHDLDTVFFPLPICDILEIIVQPKPAGNKNISFSSSGLEIPGDTTGNLCIKAYDLLKKDFPDLPPIEMHLHKNIPMGAGMGGGSADGAFTIRLLNEKFNLGLDADQMISYALQLGSDCPFFILNTPVSATGRGEIMEPVDCDLSGWKFIVINPGIHISTAAAFRQIKLNPTAAPCHTLIKQPIENWRGNLVNDFEAAVFPMHPELEDIRNRLYALDAVYASMTGSGSTIYGIFSELPDLKGIFPASYSCFSIDKGVAHRLS
jgi:4-diphosphocytidyl-2-C-methyl-D-erythritol kinase